MIARDDPEIAPGALITERLSAINARLPPVKLIVAPDAIVMAPPGEVYRTVSANADKPENGAFVTIEAVGASVIVPTPDVPYPCEVS